MLAWGLIGFLAGLLAKKLVESKVLLIIYGALSGIAFSFIMDVWTTLWADGTFNIARFVASITTAAPFTVVYMVSNVIFLLLLTKPIGSKLQRLKTKYGIFRTRGSLAFPFYFAVYYLPVFCI